MCFKYRTEGGDDGPNSFESESSCRYRCIPSEYILFLWSLFSVDFFTCGGNTPPAGACSEFDPTALKCPPGYICKNGGVSSMCCDQSAESR